MALCMHARPGQFQNWYKRNWRQQKCSSSRESTNLMDCKEISVTRSLTFIENITFFDHVMRREKLEHLVTTGMIEGRRSRGKQGEKVLDGQKQWLKVGRVTEALKATGDRDVQKVMITFAKDRGT